MTQTQKICDACGAAFDLAQNVCARCGTAFLATDDFDYELSSAVDEFADDVFRARERTVEIDDFDELAAAGILPDNMHESSAGIAHSTDAFGAVECVGESVGHDDATPKKGVLVAETIEQAFREPTTVSGSVRPIQKSDAAGMQVVKKTSRRRTTAARKVTPPPIPDEFQRAWDAISDVSDDR